MSDEFLNPYAPPAASMDLPAEESTQPAAGNGKRFLNFIIDRIGVMGVGYLLGLWAAWMYEENIAKGPAEWIQQMNGVEEILLGCVLTVLYYEISESLGGRTIGKLLTGTKAVMEDGSRLKFSSALTRSLCRLIPFEPFSFLFKGGGWHDTMTGTRVIDLRARPIPKRTPVRNRPLPPGAARIPPPRSGATPRPVFRPGPAAPRPAAPPPVPTPTQDEY